MLDFFTECAPREITDKPNVNKAKIKETNIQLYENHPLFKGLGVRNYLQIKCDERNHTPVPCLKKLTRNL